MPIRSMPDVAELVGRLGAAGTEDAQHDAVTRLMLLLTDVEARQSAFAAGAVPCLLSRVRRTLGPERTAALQVGSQHEAPRCLRTAAGPPPIPCPALQALSLLLCELPSAQLTSVARSSLALLPSMLDRQQGSDDQAAAAFIVAHLAGLDEYCR